MADIIVNANNSLTLTMTEEERSTFDGLQQGQLASFVSIWLAERFKTVWTDRIAKLTDAQKKQLRAILQADDAQTPTGPAIPVAGTP